MREVVNNTNKLHYFMAAVQVTYVRVEEVGVEPKPKQKHMNVVFTHTTKNISLSVLNQPRRGVVQRMNNDFHVSPDMLRDIVFLGCFHLGLMTEKEFNDMEQPEAPKAIQ